MGVKVLINVVSSFPTVPVVTKADDLEKGILYLPIAISHCKMKRAKLTPKAKLAQISRGPVWPIKVRFGLFEPKRAGQVPFRPI